MATPRTDYLITYFNEVKFGLMNGEGPALREAREALSSLALSDVETAMLLDLDADVVDSLVQFDEIADYLLEDHSEQGLEKWWWHLGGIHRGEYPAELLPEALRRLYRPHSRAA
ncbi:hypothetical protein SAMN02949497_3774 [Methylomagnum ishizawai]|uniref:Uncharacterized protein n=1 Tax=Methylomagnum ishizawai TaxID=1760988 RepID=A0A1Y6D0B4_9GAMM|nr:hypothetical protein [Methylomagnum ishizawai]SMF96378.1 hypothetical protein SAMN02949497_3774 [Methylomagnum ishizawai]